MHFRLLYYEVGTQSTLRTDTEILKNFLYYFNNIMIRAACKIPVGWPTCGGPILTTSMEVLVTSNGDHHCDSCCW